MKPKEQAFDPNDQSIKNELLLLIIQYLDEHGFNISSAVLKDEAEIKISSADTIRNDLIALKDSFKTEDFTSVEAMDFDRFNNQKLTYLFLKYHFLKLLKQGDTSKALLFLSSKLRPYRAFEDVPGDFDYLCCLLIENDTITDLKTLQEKIIALIEEELTLHTESINLETKGRLFELIQQSASLQLSVFPLGSVKSVVEDFTPVILPQQACTALKKSHTKPIKVLSIIPDSTLLLSGSSDSTIKLWDLSTQQEVSELKGHRNIVWSLKSFNNFCVSGAGDSTIRLWDIYSGKEINSYIDHKHDVYSIDIDQSKRMILSGGFDRHLMIHDIETSKVLLDKKDHIAAITSVKFDPTGNLAISGGKDMAIKICDLRDSTIIYNFTPLLNEVTAVDIDMSFTKILGSTKDNTARIWDLRMTEPKLVLKDYLNSSKTFIRSKFGPDGRTVLSGSDNGKLIVWGATSGNMLASIPAHNGPMYDVCWCEKTKSFITCGEDSIIRLWKQK